MMILRKALLHLGKPRRFGLGEPDPHRPTEADYRRIAREMDEVLVRHDTKAWFPRCIDWVHGGFISNYSNTWRPLAAQSKRLVFQARMTWFTAEVSERVTSDCGTRFRDHSLHGLKFLRETMWDSKRGGFFWELTNEGTLPRDDPDEKHAYGLAFGIYACANVARVTRNREALELAQRAFRWLEEHAHDEVNGGYRETLAGDGTPLPNRSPRPVKNRMDTPHGYKSANTHIHLLESFTGLHAVWPDPLVRSRLEELFRLVRDRMFVLPGCLHQHFTADFRPVPDLISYGHDVETGYLLIEAARALGLPEDAVTWERARLLVDNALTYGFDGTHGGLFDTGPAFHPATGQHKIWWAQAELLNVLFLLHERFGADDLRYWTAFTRTWRYICECQVDSRNGGWHEQVWADNRPIIGPKGTNWKEAYHTGRALLNVSKGLRRLGHEPLPEIEL